MLIYNRAGQWASGPTFGVFLLYSEHSHQVDYFVTMGWEVRMKEKMLVLLHLANVTLKSVA